MSIHFITAAESAKYNEFVKSHPLGTIHQTYEWGLFQSKTPGRTKFWVVAVEDGNGAIIASALVIRQQLPFKKCWLYCPRGPLVDYTNPEALKTLTEKIAALAHEEKAVFFRFDPAIQTVKTLTLIKARPAHAHYQPEHTLIVDLTPESSQILAQMKPKGRYNIKVAQKHGVTIHHTHDVEKFYQLLCETTTRDNFSGHSLKYYQDMLAIFGKTNAAKLYVAEYQNKIVAAAIVTYFKDTATYYFGASSNENRNIMAPYLLHWQIMQDARTSGYKHYDLFGIAPPNEPNHPWATVTDFKLKFGGERTSYMPAQEIVYQPFWYSLLKMAKWVRGHRIF